jgi:hypothetical protein
MGPHTNFLFAQNLVCCSLSSKLRTNSYAWCRCGLPFQLRNAAEPTRKQKGPAPENAPTRLAFAGKSSTAAFVALSTPHTIQRCRTFSWTSFIFAACLRFGAVFTSS